MARQITTTETNVDVPGTDYVLTLGSNTHDQEHEMLFHVAETKGAIVVGYLVHDPDCSDPRENDCSFGAIYSSSRRASKDNHAGFQKAFGLDSDFQPDYTLVTDEAIMALIKEDIELWAVQGGNETYENLVVCAQHREEDTELQRVLSYVKELFDDETLDAILPLEKYAENAWVKGRNDGTIGDKHAVALDVYEHGGISYSVSGEGQQCAFDTAKGGAVWVPNDEAKANFVGHPDEGQKRRSFARQVAQTFTEWSNGENYGIVIELHDIDKDDGTCTLSNEVHSCWGFIGREAAMEDLKEQFNHYVKENYETQD